MTPVTIKIFSKKAFLFFIRKEKLKGGVKVLESCQEALPILQTVCVKKHEVNGIGYLKDRHSPLDEVKRINKQNVMK